MRRLYIGIDPDIAASGLAVIDATGEVVELRTAEFCDLLATLRRYADGGEVSRVVVEASWTATKNWHLPATCSKAFAAALGRSVGMNHATGIHLAAYARTIGLPTTEQPPLRKCWKGSGGKITHDELAAFVNGLPRRINQEERDALLLAWVTAGLRIRIKR